jgi:hypothetical protein
VHALTFNPAATEAWLRSPSSEHPNYTRAEALGVEEGSFGRGVEGFLRTVEDLLAHDPPGLTRRGDITDVGLWRIPDGEVLDQGALITVDLAIGVRLTTLHQDIRDFADRDARGVVAAVAALAHIANQASLAVRGYERSNPTYAPRVRSRAAAEPAPATASTALTRDGVGDGRSSESRGPSRPEDPSV